MFRNSYQHGAFCIFHSGGSKPFELWDIKVQDGYLERYLDQDLKKMVIEIGGTNVSTTYMTCPKGKKVLGISMPFLIMTVKNLKRYFTFEVTILDNTNTRRRFRVANFQSTTQILPFCTAMPICLADGWNQIQFNLAEFTNRAYKREYVETQNLKVNASIRIRQIYFAERLLNEEELPPLLQLHLPLTAKRQPLTAEETCAPNPSLEKIDKSEIAVSKTSTESVGSPSNNKKASKDKVAVDSEKRAKSHFINKNKSVFTKKTKERKSSSVVFSNDKKDEKKEVVQKESLDSVRKSIIKLKIVDEIVEELVAIDVSEDTSEKSGDDVVSEESLKTEQDGEQELVYEEDEKENMQPPNEEYVDE